MGRADILLRGTLAARSCAKQATPAFKRIITVCAGSICRILAAAYLLHQWLTGRDGAVANAGLLHMGGVQHGSCSTCAGGRVRQVLMQWVTPVMLRRGDQILPMEKSQIHGIARLAPEVSGKVFVLDKWGEARDIPDPHRQQREAFEHFYPLIDQTVPGWLFCL